MIIGIIPARYGSTRLPGKMLADIGGKPLLWHTWTRASRARRLDRLVIAAGDEVIAQAARDFGAEVVEAFEDVPSGSDRVFVAWRKLVATDGNSDVVLNIQGDEPQIDPVAIDAAVDALLGDSEAGVGTVVAPIGTEAEYNDPSVVKVVIDARHRAIYFSRSPIPHTTSFDFQLSTFNFFRHMGLYAFRPTALERFTRLPQSPLELTERLEQLRLLDAGEIFAVGLVAHAGMEVNTPEDLVQVRSAYQAVES